MPKMNWQEVNASGDGDFERLEPGCYVCKVTGVEPVPDREYVRLVVDIAEGPNKGFFSDPYYAEHTASHGIVMSWKSPRALEMTKGRLELLRDSNKGFDPFAAFDADQWDMFKDRYIGVGFGEEEYEARDTGEIRTSVRAQTTMTAQDAHEGKGKVPRPKKLRQQQDDGGSGGGYNSSYGGSSAPTGGSAYQEKMPWE